MPLRKHKASIKFSSGVQGKVDHKILPKEYLVTLENGRFDKLGAINKRTGYSLVDKASSDIVDYKNSIVSRNVIIGDRASSGTVTAASVYNYSSGEFIGDKGYSDGIDYTLMPVSKGSQVRQEDSNVAFSDDGKYACITFVDVSWDQANDKEVYDKRVSIVDRETNSLVASDIKIGTGSNTGNRGRRMRPIWLTSVDKFYIIGDDDLSLKAWVIDPTASTIQVKNIAGTVTPSGTDLLTSTYPLASNGDFVISGASFDICGSATASKINLIATHNTSGIIYYMVTDAGVVSNHWGVAYSAGAPPAVEGHYYIHNAGVTGTHANKLSFAYVDADNLLIKTGTDAAGVASSSSVGIGSGATVKGAFRDSLNPLVTTIDDVQFVFEHGQGGASGQYQIIQIDGIHANLTSAIGNFRYLSKKSRFAFALGRGPVSLGIYHDDNSTVSTTSDAPINTIEIVDTDTNDHSSKYSSRITDFLDTSASLPSSMFNGSKDVTNTNPCSSDTNETMSVTFDPPIAYASHIKFYVGANASGAEYTWQLNGTGGFTGMGTGTGATLVEAHAGSGTLTQLQFKKASGNMDVFTVEVDGTILYDPSSPVWQRDHLPISTFDPSWAVDTFQSASVTGLASSHLNGSGVAVPVGNSFERFGLDGALALNSITNLFDFRNYNEERVDIPAPSRGMLHDILYVADKGLFQYDGDKFHIVGFHDRPSFGLALVTTSGLLGNGVYYYKVVYEWVDAQGNLHESEPSGAVTVTTDGSNEQVNVTIAELDYGGFNTHPNVQTQYRENVRAAIYRTQVGGSTYNNIMTIPLGGDEDGKIVVRDNIADAVAATGKFLYTTGGALANKAAPASARYVIPHRDRVFIIGKDDVVYYSKLVNDGFGAAFNEALYIKTPDNISDPPTALGSMDGNLFVFTEKSIYLISGEGPDNLGAGGFYDAKKVPTTAGAMKGSPVRLIDDGLLFVSSNGVGSRIYLLGRNMSVSHIGNAVEHLLNPAGGTPYIVRDMTAMPEQETVFFLLSQTSGTESGAKVITLNYALKQWGIDNLLDTYAAGAGGSLAFGLVGGIKKLYISLLHHETNKNPRLYTEATGYKDNSVYVPMKIKTAWINLAGIQSYQRVYGFHILGESIDKHTLTVNVYYDYDTSTIVDAYTFSTTSATDAVLQFKGHLSKQKCQAIQFEVVDADNSGSTDEGYTLTEIALELGLRADGYKQANAKLSSTSTIGSDS